MEINKVKYYYNTEVFQKECFEQELELELGNRTIALTARSEDVVFYDDRGEAEASIFLQAYVKKGTPEERRRRPVFFLWNGGPGSASSLLQLECFGPFLLKKNEREQVTGEVFPDPESLIDIADFVYMDQVGVGYSRLIKKEKAEKYYSVDGDARCYAFAISKWLKENGRLFSDFYLVGESYGTVRACRVLAELGRSPFSESRMVLGLVPKGVILIGNATSMDEKGSDSMLEPGLSLTTAMLPSMAATYRYHHPENGKTASEEELRAFAEAAYRFGETRLEPVLQKGKSLSEEEKKRLAETMEGFTGISRAYWEEHQLEISEPEEFLVQTAADKGVRCDLYDSRMTVPLEGSYNLIGNEDNIPLKVMNSTMEELRGITTERMYYTGNLTCYPYWNYKVEDLGPATRTHIGCLKQYLQANAGGKVLFASGLFDLCTLVGNTRVQIKHAGLPIAQVTVKEYLGGHGVYSSKEGKQQFLKDIRSFLSEKR